jgi:ABC-type lipoprotein export system ATPase subunit
VTAAVEVRDAFRVYSSSGTATVALQGLTLTVEVGEIVVLLGPSGSGKSTLLRAIAGFDRLSAGRIEVLGTDLAGLGGRRLAAYRARTMGVLDQHYGRSLSPELSCRDSISLQLRLMGRHAGEGGRVADELLRRVGLAGREDDRPATLSGGEQQRVAVCASLAHRPSLLLADEPAGELDARSAQTIYDLIGELARETGTTALLVSHDPAAAAIADRIVQVRDGRVVEEALRGKPPALVVSRTGWVRIPVAAPSSREQVRMAVESRGDELILRKLGPTADDGGAGEDKRAPRSAHGPASPFVVASLRGVAKSYAHGQSQNVVFERLSHEIPAGRLLAVVGRSGSGKTTLLHLLAGLVRPTDGDVVLLGESLVDKRRSELAQLRREHVALVTQQPGLVSYLTAEENVALGLSLRSHRNGTTAQAQEALTEVGLSERLGHRTEMLSAGEQQRVAIARALAAEPSLLLVDEPTARLDAESARQIGYLLCRAARHAGRAVVVATHDPDLIALCDEIIPLERHGPPELAVRPRS